MLLALGMLLGGCRSHDAAPTPSPTTPEPVAAPAPAEPSSSATPAPAPTPTPEPATDATATQAGSGEPTPPVAAAPWAVTRDELDAMVRLDATLPALSRDGARMAIAPHGEVGRWSDLDLVEVWVFELAAAERDYGARPAEVMPLVTVEDVREATDHPTTALRDRITARVRRANERLAELGFGEGPELEEASDLVEKGDALLSRWRYRRYTITESATDPLRLEWVEGRRRVMTTTSPYGPEEMRCMDAPVNHVFPDPTSTRFLVLTHARWQTEASCEPNAKLQLADPTR